MNKIVSILSVSKNITIELKNLLPNVTFKNIDTEDDYEQLKNSEIVIADFDLIKPHLYSLQNTKWVQGTWAGVDKIINEINLNKPLPFILNRYSDKHFGRLMSEYVVANIVNYERNMFGIHENNKNKFWNRDGKIFCHRTISDLTIGILGIGSIGNHIAKTLNMFGARIWGFGRQERSSNDLKSEKYSHVEEYCTYTNLTRLLQNCDYIVSVLPHTTETKDLLSGDILKHCAEKQSVLINIGRGSVIDENDLMNAIEKQWISAAILDVFQDEPLPSTSKLWTYEEIFITPHVSGVSRAKDIAEYFKENLILYQDGKELPNQVNTTTGY